MSNSMIANALPHLGSQAAQNAQTRKPLSCTSCRQRKIKCDKVDPCDPCLKAGIECIFPTRRIRAPRGRRDAVEARDVELLRRIRHLEGMLANKIDTGPAGPDGGRSSGKPSPILVSPLPSSGALGEGNKTGVTVDDHYATFVKQQGSSSRHLNSEFWSSLTHEFDGLRQLIEGCVDDENDFDDSTSHSTEAIDPSPNFILQDPDSFIGSEILYPSDAHSAVLFQFYFTNVDPVCKILHRPTVNTYFSNVEALLDPLTRRFKFRSLEAVTFAAYFAAVTSMSTQECLTYLGEPKDILIARYKRSTEEALVQADFLNSLEITTLQALTIYIVVQRSLSRARFSWTLIGLAVRIAHGFGLHRDGDGRAFSAFEAEMRRRIWWQILALDLRASEDRGSEPVLEENSFTTVMPCNLNDEDLQYDSQHPLHSRTGPTEMTLCLLSMDALCTGWKINLRSPASESKNLTLQEREELVKKYGERVESTYIASGDFFDQRTRLLRMMGHYWIYKLWLILYYPLQHRMPSQQAQSRNQGLQTAVKFLSVNESIEQHSFSAGFAWLFKTYAPWHAVAVILVELCNHPRGPLADRAWEIIQSRFKDWNGRVADIKEAILWSPIKNLLKRARVARQHGQELFKPGQALSPSDLDSILQEFDVSETPNPVLEGGEGGSSIEPQSLNSFGLIDQTMDQPLDFLSFTPIDTVVTETESLSASNDWDNWNDFTFDVNALSGEFVPEPYKI